MIVTCTRRIQFCAGHRVLGHENKCAALHGHNYVVYVYARAECPELQEGEFVVDSIGRVIDFSVLKERIGGWIEDNWDHGFILHKEDRGARDALGIMSVHMEQCENRKPQKLFLMPYNPTAENMARFLVTEIAPRVMGGTNVTIHKCVVHETENCSAEYID